jgi:hypothetical protein
MCLILIESSLCRVSPTHVHRSTSSVLFHLNWRQAKGKEINIQYVTLTCYTSTHVQSISSDNLTVKRSQHCATATCLQTCRPPSRSYSHNSIIRTLHHCRQQNCKRPHMDVLRNDITIAHLSILQYSNKYVGEHMPCFIISRQAV